MTHLLLCVSVRHLLHLTFLSSFLLLLQMFSISILAVLLLLLPPRADGAATPTYWDTDPQTGEQVECDRCRPGTYLRVRCTATQKSVCAPCPSGSFTELWNYIGKCLRCGVCGPSQVVKRPCTADRDCQCQCQQGFYYRSQSDMCRRHSECPVGQGVLSNGRRPGPGWGAWGGVFR